VANATKRIEQRTVRKRETAQPEFAAGGGAI
jgi:hypothetical protein